MPALLVLIPLRVDATEDRGQQLYKQACTACHGTDASGAMPGVPDLTGQQGALSKPDAILLQNLVTGMQTPGAAIGMPPKAGNPSLTDEDLRATLDYLRRTTGIRSEARKPTGDKTR